MPKFLEDKLRAEYGDNPHAIYGTMNKIGAMKGNKETAKGKAMEKKHNAKMKAKPESNGHSYDFRLQTGKKAPKRISKLN